MNPATRESSSIPAPIAVSCPGRNIDELLATEWLLANRIGAYASSTVIGCNTRRYHGLLAAATVPPVGRIVALSAVMDRLTVDGAAYELSTFEFPDAFSPSGVDSLAEFRNDIAPTFIFRIGDLELVKRIILAERANAVAIQYVLSGRSGSLLVRPLAAMRDFHAVRRVSQPQKMTFESIPGGMIVRDRANPDHSLYLTSQEADIKVEPQWWHRFRYRADEARGHDGLEDLYSPGTFAFELRPGQRVQINASVDDSAPPGFDTTIGSRRRRLQALIRGLGSDADETTRRLALAADAFIVRRNSPAAIGSATLLAGYHWFADWGRDAMIALPGLLLCTGSFDTARQVLATFAGHISEGMIPNRFDDYRPTAHYNSIDASLWFIVAAYRYLAATQDAKFWRDTLRPVAATILAAYEAGTRFGIRADADGLLTGGSLNTQLTWMDAKAGQEPVTARHGKAVEVNALWYCAHRILAENSRGVDEAAAAHHAGQAELIAAAFARTFWNDQAGCLYDCVNDDHVDASVRPNQIFAVSLPYSPLTRRRQQAVLDVVGDKLLTPYGLRTLSPEDPRYRGSFGRTPDQRDAAYHQGMVWPWLLGAYVEAYLKLNGTRKGAAKRAAEMLNAFDEHLLCAGLGQISEVFDGDRPHRAGGCIAQAWSVAEILRAKQLVAQCAKASAG